MSQPTMWSRLRLAVATALVAACALTPLALRHHARAAEREQERLLRERAVQLAELSAESERLSNLVAHTENGVLPPAQLNELLKLRGEIGQLRQALDEANNLAARNRQLAAALTNADMSPRASSLPEGQPVHAYWPRAQLGFAGYSDPTAALKTTLWAMTQGDPDALAGSVTPEVKAKMLREDWFEHGSPAEELAASARRIADSLQPANGFYVIGQRSISQDQVVVDVFFEGEGRTRKFAMKKVGAEWKFNALGRASSPDNDVHPGFSAWP